MSLRTILTGTDFNSQPHKEADEISATEFYQPYHFNSQPHKEADLQQR